MTAKTISGPRFFLPWRARYQQEPDGTWSGTYGRSHHRHGSYVVSGLNDELEARKRLREFVMWRSDK